MNRTFHCYDFFAHCDGDDLGSEIVCESARSCADKNDNEKMKGCIGKDYLSESGGCWHSAGRCS
jgi:hypothetical protein